MAGIIVELLVAIVRGLIAESAYSGILKVGAMIDRYIGGGVATVIIGMSVGFAAYFLVPILLGALGL